jgi:hypothetical protein
MTRDPDFDSDLEALVEAGKLVPSLPDVVRARALARARATVAAEPFRSEQVAGPHRRVRTLALAASVAVAVAGASAWAALSLRGDRRGDARPPAAAPAVAPPPIEASEASEAPKAPPLPAVAALAPSTPAPRPHRAVHSPTARESYAAELALLKRAQVAYAEGDDPEALALVAEHGRRFPSGRLAEEREALRVRTLTRTGRTEDARQAAAAFAVRFPRSVLLPRSSKTAP